MKPWGLCFLLLGALPSHSQDSLTLNPHHVKPGLPWLKATALDTRDAIVQPLKWGGRQWLAAAGLGGLVAIAFWQDDNIREVFIINRDDDADFYMQHLVNPFGNLYAFTIVLSTYVQGSLANNGRNKKVALDAARALILTAASTRAAKWISNRERPYQDGPDLPYDPNPFDDDDKRYESFFSGHTASAFCVAAVMADAYRETKAVPYIAYGIAGSVGISRLYLDKHWASDVLVGAAVGWYIGHTVAKSDHWKIQVRPYASPAGTGLKIGHLF